MQSHQSVTAHCTSRKPPAECTIYKCNIKLHGIEELIAMQSITCQEITHHLTLHHSKHHRITLHASRRMSIPHHVMHSFTCQEITHHLTLHHSKHHRITLHASYRISTHHAIHMWSHDRTAAHITMTTASHWNTPQRSVICNVLPEWTDLTTMVILYCTMRKSNSTHSQVTRHARAQLHKVHLRITSYTNVNIGALFLLHPIKRKY